MLNIDEIIARDRRAITGEEPYEVLWEMRVTDDGMVFIPHRRVEAGVESWENEGGH